MTTFPLPAPTPDGSSGASASGAPTPDGDAFEGALWAALSGQPSTAAEAEVPGEPAEPPQSDASDEATPSTLAPTSPAWWTGLTFGATTPSAPAAADAAPTGEAPAPGAEPAPLALPSDLPADGTPGAPDVPLTDAPPIAPPAFPTAERAGDSATALPDAALDGAPMPTAVTSSLDRSADEQPPPSVGPRPDPTSASHQARGTTLAPAAPTGQTAVAAAPPLAEAVAPPTAEATARPAATTEATAFPTTATETASTASATADVPAPAHPDAPPATDARRQSATAADPARQPVPTTDPAPQPARSANAARQPAPEARLAADARTPPPAIPSTEPPADAPARPASDAPPLDAAPRPPAAPSTDLATGAPDLAATRQNSDAEPGRLWSTSDVERRLDGTVPPPARPAPPAAADAEPALAAPIADEATEQTERPARPPETATPTLAASVTDLRDAAEQMPEIRLRSSSGHLRQPVETDAPQPPAASDVAVEVPTEAEATAETLEGPAVRFTADAAEAPDEGATEPSGSDPIATTAQAEEGPASSFGEPSEGSDDAFVPMEAEPDAPAEPAPMEPLSEDPIPEVEAEHARLDAPAGRDLSGPTAAKPTPVPRAASGWSSLLIQQLDGAADPNGEWATLSVDVGDGDGRLTLRARHDEGRLVVNVHLSDPAVRAAAILEADAIRARLEDHYGTSVDLAFDQGTDSQGDRPTDDGRGTRRPTPPSASTPAVAPRRAASPPTAPATARREWIG